MFPSLRPVTRSMSSGVMTWRWMIALRMFGAKHASVSMTASPKASRFRSSHPPLMLYGAYWTKIYITCLPGGAIPESIIDGMTMSMYGCFENSPYLASSYARST